MVEDALQRCYSGEKSTGENLLYGLPGLWKYIGMGSRRPVRARNGVYISIAELDRALTDPESELLLTPWH